MEISEGSILEINATEEIDKGIKLKVGYDITAKDASKLVELIQEGSDCRKYNASYSLLDSHLHSDNFIVDIVGYKNLSYKIDEVPKKAV
jgi:hypothetical protein